MEANTYNIQKVNASKCVYDVVGIMTSFWPQTQLLKQQHRHIDACVLSNELSDILWSNKLHIGIDCNTLCCCVQLVLQ